jgi:hypothetical protein
MPQVKSTQNRSLPGKSPFPKGGCWRWSHRYFDVGDSITWLNNDGEVRVAKVSRIKKNHFGRISYYAKNSRTEFVIFTESIAHAQENFRRCSP